MRQQATILDSIEAGLRGNPARVRASTELLIQRIEEEAEGPKVERDRDVTALRRLLECIGVPVAVGQKTTFRTGFVLSAANVARGSTPLMVNEVKT